MSHLHLLSHELCPYVQRAAILLHEKNIEFEKTYIDLDRKPEWFLKVSPLGKVPVLKVDDEVLFESAVICEYLDETHGIPLLPSQPMPKARQRGWMEFSSVLLTEIWKLSTATTEDVISKGISEIDQHFARLEQTIKGPFFSGTELTMVDVFFAPVFRYFDVLDTLRDFQLFQQRPLLQQWRRTLAARSSVQRAVPEDYPQRLRTYMQNKGSLLAGSPARERDS